MRKKQIPVILIPLGILLVFLIWLKPGWFGLISESYDVNNFRNNYKDIINIIYVGVTIWLVYITKKTLDINLYAQKALNEPLLDCQLVITQEKLEANNYDVKALKMHAFQESNYVENAEGASVYLLIKNINGFGKATNVKVVISVEANIPDKISIKRMQTFQYLLADQAVALYFYRFERPSLQHSLNIEHVEISYSNPFDEASDQGSKKIIYNKNKTLSAIGNMAQSIKLGDGIKSPI